MTQNKLAVLGATVLAMGIIAASAQTKNDAAQKAPSANNIPLIDSMDGAVLYRAYCASCHGADAAGRGPMTLWLTITPPGLTRISARNGGEFPLLKVQQIISGEANTVAVHGPREMPVWGPIFSRVTWDQDLGRMRVYNLAKYIESIQAR